MPEIQIKSRIRKWGNTYGITVSPREIKRLRVEEGAEVHAVISTRLVRVDFSDVAVLRGPDPYGSRDHDRLLGEAMDKEAKRWRRRS